MNRKDHACLSDCVAKFFDMPPERVPFFIEHKDWCKRLKRFFKRRGFKLEFYHYDKRLLQKENKLYFVQGISPRMKKQRREHMVLYKGNKKFFDSHPSRDFLRGEPIWIYVAHHIKNKNKLKSSQQNQQK